MKQEMKAAIYARCSTHDKGQDPELQLAPLREYCQKRGFTISGEYVDKGISGTKDRRPELDQLLQAARKRQVDLILVWKLDRFGRSLKQLVTVLDELTGLGVGFISYQDNLDLTTAQGRLMFHIIGAMAEFERELIKERVKAGLDNARRKGKRLGRKPLPPLIVKQVITTHVQDPSRSVRQVAKLAEAAPATVARILRDYRAGVLNTEGSRCEMA